MNKYKQLIYEFLNLQKKYHKRIANIELFFQNWKGDSQDEKIEFFHELLKKCKILIDCIPIYIENRDLSSSILRLNKLAYIFEQIDKTLNLKYFKSAQNISFSNDLNSYINVAQTTVSFNSASQLLRAIESNIGSHDCVINGPFFAIVGPSFMGKTQMAFILAAFKYPVIYFNFGDSDANQEIYKNFSTISNHMDKSLLEDLDNFFPSPSGSIGPGTSEILYNETMESKSLGFLYALIKRASEFNFNEKPWLLEYCKLESFFYEPLSLDNFNDKYSN
jgi:hypothetical protein